MKELAGMESIRKMTRTVMAALMGVSLVALSSAAHAESGIALSSSPVSSAASNAATASASSELKPVISSEFMIGPGDVLDISVWKDEALTRSCVVRPDGFISFPLVGEVKAAGKTAAQLRTELGKNISRYVPDAVLSVEVRQINSLIIYVIGRVNAPGRFVMNTNVDVLQALATAGGLNVFAKRNHIKIFRQEKNETTIFPFEYDEIVEGNRLEQNIQLKRGDVVVIP
jgi:polysaccharide export outer membrane protein